MLPGGALVTEALGRARDPQGTATTRIQTLALVSTAQQVVNGILADIIGSANVVVQPRTALYQISAYLPSAVQILAVRDASGRDLEPLNSIDQLFWISSHWLTAVGSEIRSFLSIGRDLLILYPNVLAPQT